MFWRKGAFVRVWPFVIICLFVLSACGGSNGGAGSGSASGSTASSKLINVVAAENFYGDIVKQLGGSHVDVTSILSDPNVDPHEYTSNVQTAQKVSEADLIVENSGGYDDWMDKLLSGSPNSHRIVVKGYDLATTRLPENEHVWYGINNIAPIAQGITDALKKLDSADASTFDSNLATFKQSLTPLQQKIGEINSKYQGTPVALTETIYLYQTTPEGLNVLTPFEFMKANAEGTDPPANAVTAINNEVNLKQVKILIYNVQTVTPITTNVQNAAKKQHIPIVPVSETMPSGKSYQSWMMDQLNALEAALQQGTGR